MVSSQDKKTSDFDPYHQWLGIPQEDQPPSHYRILGITDGESVEDVIRAAGVRQSAYVRNFQSGPHGEDAVKILNEIGEAIGTLTDREKRIKYEDEFRRLNPEFDDFTDDFQYPDTQQETNTPDQSAGFADPYPSLPRQVSSRRPQRNRRGTEKPFIEKYWIWGPAMLITVIATVLIYKQFGTDSNPNEQIAKNPERTPVSTDPLENPPSKIDPIEEKPLIDPINPPPSEKPKPKINPEKQPDPVEKKPVVDPPPMEDPKPKVVPEKKTVPVVNRPVIDLLKKINVRRSSIDGRWTLTNGILRSPSGRNPKFTIANSVPAEYDLRMRVERLSGPRALIVIAPVDGYQVPCYFDYAQGRPGRYTGVGTYEKGGPDEQRNPHIGAVLRRNVPVDIEIAVRNGSLTIKVGSKDIYQWKGVSSRFQINEAWQNPNKRALYLGVSYSKFRITKLELVDQTPSDGN